MTERQHKYVAALARKAGETFDPNMSQREASNRIDQLQAKLGGKYAKKRSSAPHTSREEAMKVACPQCGAPAGRACRRRGGGARVAQHRRRHDAL